MKTLYTSLLVAIPALVSTMAHAEISTRYQVVAVDQAPETKLCMIAATDGFEAARKAALTEGYDLDKSSTDFLCNGKSVYRFSKTYSDKDVSIGVASFGSN